MRGQQPDIAPSQFIERGAVGAEVIGVERVLAHHGVGDVRNGVTFDRRHVHRPIRHAHRPLGLQILIGRGMTAGLADRRECGSGELPSVLHRVLLARD